MNPSEKQVKNWITLSAGWDGMPIAYHIQQEGGKSYLGHVQDYDERQFANDDEARVYQREAIVRCAVREAIAALQVREALQDIVGTYDPGPIPAHEPTRADWAVSSCDNALANLDAVMGKDKL